MLTKLLLKSSSLDTPLGPMLALADEHKLYLLEFADNCCLDKQIDAFAANINAVITPGITEPIISIEKELKAYFDGTLTVFKTSVHFSGSTFQQSVWKELQNTPYGQTRSYLSQATAIGNQKACRAVANANGANQIAIVIPCHRIINSSGKLGGYKAGLERKEWLLNHEKNHTL